MKRIIGLAVSTLAFAISQSLAAQQVSDIEVVEVTGNQQSLNTLNPGDNTLKGIFGSGLSAAETPRAVTSLSAEAIEALNINDLHDIVKAAPNAYASRTGLARLRFSRPLAEECLFGRPRSDSVLAAALEPRMVG